VNVATKTSQIARLAGNGHLRLVVHRMLFGQIPADGMCCRVLLQ